MAAEGIDRHIDSQDKEKIAFSGMDFQEKERSATFFQKDAEVLLSRSLSGSVDILDIKEALANDSGARKYLGESFRLLGKEYPKNIEGGYFIRIKKGKTVELPIQACLFLKAQGFKQKVHNLVIVEEGAKVNLITGCSASRAAKEGFHLGISEFYVEKGAYLNFTMIHNFREDTSVKPMSVAVVKENGTFVSNYVCLKPVKEVVMYPTAIISGRNGRVSFNSLILSYPDSVQDIGSRIILNAEGGQGEIISRAVSVGGKIIARGHLKAGEKNTKGHLECRGLVLSEKGGIHAIPELETDLQDVDLSHEAAIGKINKEEIDYLCSRGMTASEAQSTIVRGFMDVNILALPEIIKNEIKKLEEKMLEDAF